MKIIINAELNIDSSINIDNLLILHNFGLLNVMFSVSFYNDH